MSQRATLVGGDRGQGDAGPGSSLALATLHQVAVNTPKLTHTPTDTHTHTQRHARMHKHQGMGAGGSMGGQLRRK